MITPEEGDGQQAADENELPQDEMEQLQAIVNDAFGVKPTASEPVAETPDDDTEEVEFEGENLRFKRDELKNYARQGFALHKEKAALAKEKETLREMAERLQNADAMTSGLMQFLGDDRNSAQAQMIANIVRGRPITEGVNLHPHDARALGLAAQEAAAQSRRRQQEEEVDEQDDDEEEDDFAPPPPKRGKRQQKPQTDPALLQVLEGLGQSIRTISERQQQIDDAIRAQREAEQKKVVEAQQRAFHDRIEAAILNVPQLRKLGMQTAKTFVEAQMRRTGTRDPQVAVQHVTAALNKLTQSAASDAVKTRGKVEAAHAVVPKGGSVPTERMKSAGAAMPPLGTPEFVDRALEALASGQ